MFNTNANIRKLVNVWDMFGPPNAPARNLNPRFFGNNFYTAAKIYKNLEMASRNRASVEKWWLGFLDRNLSNVDYNRKSAALKNLLGVLDIQMMEENSNFFKRTKEYFMRDFKSYEHKINIWLGRIFGFKLPRKLDIVLDYSEELGSRGSSLVADPIVISLRGSRYDHIYVSVMIHEILHSLIRKKGIIQKRKSYFEEALLCYFAPEGILTEELGLTAKMPVDKICLKNSYIRPYLKDNLEKLLPIIKRYHNSGRKSIWEYVLSK